MKKLIAFLLASVMVACCFAVSASAADTNLVAGKSYTLVSSDEVLEYYSPNLGDHSNPPTEGSTMELWSGQVTDGKVRVGTEESKIKDAAAGISLEMKGSLRNYTYTFNLGAEKGISSVVVRVVKIYGNRIGNLVGVEVSSDGSNWSAVDYTKRFDVVANSEQGNVNYGTNLPADNRDMIFDITASFATVNASYIRVILDTSCPEAEYGNFYCDDNGSGSNRGFILQFDEIEVYGGEPVSEQPPVNDPSESEPVDDPSESDPVDDPSESDPVDDPSEDVSVDDPSEDVSVDDPSEDVSVDDPSEDVSVDDPSEDVSVDDPSEDVSVDDPSENAPVESEDDNTSVEQPGNNSTPSTGDAGLAVFAVLAVVSMAGVVVAKKVK